MNCLVCVKQVPDTDRITVDPVRHTLIREGVPAILNPYDANALELALRIAENTGGSVTALSMGPLSAKETLEKCLAVGADAAFLISGRAFGGADTLATGYALAAGIRQISRVLDREFDLILCGKQAIDGDTAQVGPILAQYLSLPQITGIRDITVENNRICVLRQSGQWEQTLSCDLPALVTVSATARPLRLPSLKGKLAARKKEIPVLDEAAIAGLDIARCGLSGSPTRVVRAETPPQQGCCTMLDTPEQLAELLSALTGEKGGQSHAENQ